MRLKCFCGKLYTARQADVNRGWGKTCSKSCAAIKRESGAPDATLPDGSPVAWGKSMKRSSKGKRRPMYSKPKAEDALDGIADQWADFEAFKKDFEV